MKIKKNISVIGLGYIGLPTAALLASNGYFVNGTDIKKEAVTLINSGKVHIVEPGLDILVKNVVESKNLVANIELKKADIYIICVPTPFEEDSDIPSPDLQYVKSAASSISKLIKENDIVILESTSPVGTTNIVKEIIDKNTSYEIPYFLAYCPERVLPGNIIHELKNNDRVIGGIDELSSDVVSNFYSTFVNGDLFVTNSKTAEMCKLIENSFRDVNIAFANELSILCEKNGVDVWDLINLANRHPRVNILQPSAGVGGHCIAVDPWFIVSNNPSDAKIIKTAREINDSKPYWVADKIINKAEELGVSKILCLGLAFKPDIDDLRESPAIKIVDLILKKGYDVSCVEPNIEYTDRYKIVKYDENIDEFSLVAVLVKHKEFNSHEFKLKLNSKNVLDFCGSYL